MNIISRKAFINNQTNLLVKEINNSSSKIKELEEKNFILNFGKYKNTKLSEVKIINFNYVKFLASDNFQPKMPNAIKAKEIAINLTK